MADPTQLDDQGGQVAQVESDDDSGMTPTDDGGAIAQMDPEQQKQGDENRSFFENLAPTIRQQSLSFLDKLATTLIDAIERDKKSRKKRDEEYAESIRRTGLGKDAPGGAEFDGASKVVHPVLMEACVDFAAQAIREILPSNGPVRTYIPGKDIQPKRLEKADRKREYMNWQFTTQMPEFRSELDTLLPQLALGGSQYMRLTPDTSRKRVRPVPQYISSDMISIPYSASSFYSAERQTYHEAVTRMEFNERVESKMYDYKGQVVNPQLPTPTASQKASNRVEGKDESDYYNEDGLRIVHECSTFLDLDDALMGEESSDNEADLSEDAEDEAEERARDPSGKRIGIAPYIISIDESTRQVVSIVRNWEQDDEYLERMQWIVEFPFVPWRGAYTIGLGQMVGGLAGSATGALRALLDTSHVNNIPTLLKLKGANFSGQSKQVAATGILEIDGGATNATDIRQIVMNVPFNEPSPVLQQLLGFCVDAAKGVVRTTFEDLSEDNANLPVGTTLALIEQGMKVTSAIHLRLHHAMTYVIRILHRINKMYLTNEEVQDDTGVTLCYASDFDGPVDCVPTADPEIFSEVQRMAQWQIVMQRVDMAPDLYNRREAEKRFLERTKIPDPDGLLVPEQKPTQMNPVNENAAMSLGRPVAVFPEQDHLAHLQVHLDFLNNPTLGRLATIAPKFTPAMAQHLSEHVVMWYVTAYHEMTKRVIGKDGKPIDDDEMALVMKQRDPETIKELERLLAQESPDIMRRVSKVLASLPPIAQQLVAATQQFQPPPAMPVDPNKQAETQRRAQETQLKLAQQDKEFNAEQDARFAELSMEERGRAIAAAQAEQADATDRLHRLIELHAKETNANKRIAAQLESGERVSDADRVSKEDLNKEDNLTAMRISAAELEAQRRADRSTGHGSGRNQNPQPR